MESTILNVTEKREEMLNFFDDLEVQKEEEKRLGHIPETILIIGHPGNGKSTLAYTWPSIWLWSADNKNANIPLKIRRQTKTFKEGEPAFGVALGLLDKLNNLGFTSEAGIKTIVIDTLTAFGDLMEHEILLDSNLNPEGKQALQLQHYNIIYRRVQELIRRCKAAGCDLVVTVHMDEIVNDLNETVYHPNLTGKKLETKIAGMFDHVLYMVAKDGKYFTRLKPSTRYPHAKISVPVKINRDAPAVVQDMSYKKFRDILSGTIHSTKKQSK